MGIAQDLKIAARRWALARKEPPASREGAAEREALKKWFSKFRETPDLSNVREALMYDIDARQLPWFDTGIDLEEGEWVTTLAAGRVVLSDALGIWVGPQFQLWMRVGEAGRIFNGTRDTNSFASETRGRLYLGNNFPGQWGDPTGRVSSSLRDYAKFSGGMTVVIVRWKAGAAVGLSACGESEGRLATELARLERDTQAPAGWEYLWFLGRSEIFEATRDDDHACISCNTERNVGILQHDAVFDLTPSTRISWKWKVDELPSIFAENSQLSHDYLSVAVEFENGRDITYTWSPELAAGTGYWCPLPTWKDREFHVVVRSGSAGLGEWLVEERNLEADYRHYIGEPPRRVVKIWLIAASVFQGRRGRALYRDFVVEDEKDGRRLAVS